MTTTQTTTPDGTRIRHARALSAAREEEPPLPGPRDRGARSARSSAAHPALAPHRYHTLASETEKMAIPSVQVIHPTVEPGQEDLVLPSTTQAYTESPIYARTNGYLKKWYHDIGSRVRQGELLADIDTPEVDQQLSQAQRRTRHLESKRKSLANHRHPFSGFDQDRRRFQTGSGQCRGRLRCEKSNHLVIRSQRAPP